MEDISVKLIEMNNIVKDILLGKYHLEDFYKDNGYPKVLSQEKYDKFFSERESLLNQYKEGMTNIKSIGTKGGYTEANVSSADSIDISISNEFRNTTRIDVRFPTLPSKLTIKKP
jgi:hypothetical protein